MLSFFALNCLFSVGRLAAVLTLCNVLVDLADVTPAGIISCSLIDAGDYKFGIDEAC